MHADPRLLSRPMGVEWAGWRTDTWTLQQNGWEIATDFDIRTLGIRLCLRHKMMRLYALSDEQCVEHAMSSPGYDASRLPVFRITCVAPSIQQIHTHGYDFTKFREIDAEPRVSTQSIQRIEDMNIFAAPMPGSKGEVLIDGADMSVIDHLEAIKKLQSASQQEIRDRIINQREGSIIEDRPLPKSNVVALVNYRAA